jgi:hypothetical protein
MQLLDDKDLRATRPAADGYRQPGQTSNNERTEKDLQIEPEHPHENAKHPARRETSYLNKKLNIENSAEIRRKALQDRQRAGTSTFMPLPHARQPRPSVFLLPSPP